MRVVAVAAVMGAAVLAYSVTRVRAQNSSSSSAAGVAGATATANAPIVIANGISVRALALAPGPTVTTTEASQQPPIYFTATQMPNRVMAIPGAQDQKNASADVPSNAEQRLVGSQAQAKAYATGSLVAVAGNGTAGSLGDGGAGASAELNLKFDSPYMRSGVAVAADGTIFIADTKNATVRRIASTSSSDPGIIRSVAGKWGPAQNVQLVEPMGLALDRAGNLYIADHGANAVIELHDATVATPTPGKLEVLAHVAHAAGIAVAADGSHIYIGAPESGTVLRFDAGSRGITTLVAGSGTACRAPTDGAASGAQSLCPDGLAFDGGGNLFVADSAGSRIIRVDAATQKLTTASSSISAPGEMAFDADGNLFVAEQGRNRIIELKGLGQPVASVTLTPPPAPVPPAGVPCPTIAPPSTFTSNTNFCAEPLSGITPTSAFTLTNNSNAEITGIAISTIGLAPADFVASSTSCTTTLNAGASCLINVGFQPMATGPRTATLVVTYTGATSPLASAVAGTGDDYQITLASGQLTQISVNAGATGTFMMQVVPDNIFTGTVTFICPGNLPMETTCTFTPATVNVTTPGTAVPFSAAFQTTSRVPVKPAVLPTGGGGAGSRGMMSRGAMLAIVLIAALLLLSSVGFSLRRKRLLAGNSKNKETHKSVLWSGWPHGVYETNASAMKPSMGGFAWALRWRRLKPTLLCAIALALSVAAILEGCHSGSGSSGGVTGTPAGAYKMTPQATAQAAPRGITVTLDVE
jgi:sugar lactone lactonase YvrE